MATLPNSGVLPGVDADLMSLFGDVISKATSAHARHVDLDESAWAAIVEAGVDRLTSSEGAGATWLEAAQLLRSTASAGVAVPVAENDLMAGWLCDAVGLGITDGISTLGFVGEDGVADGVPWASSADHIVLVGESSADPWMMRILRSDAVIEAGRNLAGHQRDRVTVDPLTGQRVPISNQIVRSLRLRAKLARLVQVTGALDRAVEQSVEYSLVRVQFGRPVARFQAVQHLAADAASEAHLARTAVDVAVAQLLGDESDLAALEARVAVAASVTGHAASVVVRNAHQLHGAIGTTIEHPLHRVTLPALAWRNEYGSVVEWDAVVDAKTQAAGDVWTAIVAAGASSIATPIAAE